MKLIRNWILIVIQKLTHSRKMTRNWILIVIQKLIHFLMLILN